MEQGVSVIEESHKAGGPEAQVSLGIYPYGHQIVDWETDISDR